MEGVLHYINCSLAAPPITAGYGKLTVAGTSVEMSLHPSHQDIFLSQEIRRYGCFECHEMAQFARALDDCPICMLLDVGGNIGSYSLLAAARGHTSVAFEPNKNNWQRTCASLRLNPELLHRVYVFPVGASNVSGTAHFVEPDPNNSGNGMLLTNKKDLKPDGRRALAGSRSSDLWTMARRWHSPPTLSVMLSPQTRHRLLTPALAGPDGRAQTAVRTTRIDDVLPFISTVHTPGAPVLRSEERTAYHSTTVVVV